MSEVYGEQDMTSEGKMFKMPPYENIDDAFKRIIEFETISRELWGVGYNMRLSYSAGNLKIMYGGETMTICVDIHAFCRSSRFATDEFTIRLKVSDSIEELSKLKDDPVAKKLVEFRRYLDARMAIYSNAVPTCEISYSRLYSPYAYNVGPLAFLLYEGKKSIINDSLPQFFYTTLTLPDITILSFELSLRTPLL